MDAEKMIRCPKCGDLVFPDGYDNEKGMCAYCIKDQKKPAKVASCHKQLTEARREIAGLRVEIEQLKDALQLAIKFREGDKESQ